MIEWLKRRFRAIGSSGNADDELDEELGYHLEQAIRRNLEQGMSPEEARYAARRESRPSAICLAALVPALRAASINPTLAIRGE